MDPYNRQLLDIEGCSSSESGWTMYLASPMEEDDEEYCGNNNYAGNHLHDDHSRRALNKTMKTQDADSDDSMASDASSGPVLDHYQQPHVKKKDRNHGTARSKQEKDGKSSKCSSKKNADTQDKKLVGRSKKY